MGEGREGRRGEGAREGSRDRETWGKGGRGGGGRGGGGKGRK